MPGSIRAIRRLTDPVRGRGRIPLSKARTPGNPEFRPTGVPTVSKLEANIADTVMRAVDSIPHEYLLDAVESRDVAGYARRVLAVLTDASPALEAALTEAFVASGDTAAVELGKDLARAYRSVGKAVDAPLPSEVALRFRFDRTDPRAVQWIREESSTLITNMVRSEQEAIRSIIDASFSAQQTVQQTGRGVLGQLRTVNPSAGARQFADTLGSNLNGLTARYETAVINRVNSLADDLAARGITGTKALEQMRREGDKYAERLRKSRSRTIARTERMRAHNQARLVTFQQAIDSGLASAEFSRKQWKTGPFDVCPICVAMQGQEAKVNDGFILPNGASVMSPPGHPNCRCTMTMRTDTRLYTPPENLGAGTPGDPFRTTPRDFTQTGRDLAGRPVRPPFPGARTGVGPRPGATDTQRAYSETINGRTVYDTDRIAAVHDPWVREMLENGVRYEDTRVTFMGGGSGAGKGSVQRTGQVQFRPGSTVVDSDEAKRAIPEYRKMVDEGDTRAAAYAHEESSDMAARLMAESIENGFDTVLDGTGDSTFEKMAGKVAKAREQGARRVVAEYVTIDIDEAIRRAAQRAARTGREVPEDVINGTHSAVSRIFPRLADADTFDELRLWDNMGDTPQLIYERVDGVERILNRERYEAFLRKDPDYIPARPTVATPPPSAADIVYGTNDTQGVFTEVVNGKRRYTAARTQSVHRPWLDDLMREGQASDQPTMTFLGGGSGAGKGSITDPSKGGVVQFRPGSIKVDSDEAKRAIPEYRQLLDDDNPIAAAFVHEESSDMAAAALAESLERGFDTILDGTGDSSIEKLAAKVAKARQQGARRVTAEYVTIDIDEAVRRATSRAQRTGREVPLDVIQGTHESVSRVFPEAVRRNLFDEVRLWDNTGSPPELIYQKIDGVERILNPERYEAFLRKNPDYVSPTANIPAGPSTSARPIER